MPKSSTLSYENILHNYLDADAVPVEDYLDDNGCVTGDRSNILIKEVITKAQLDAGRRYNGDKNKSVSRFILHPKLTNPIPRTERSLELKLARKISKRSKKDLRGFWETLVPGCTVVRTSPTTTAIKEPGVPEVKVRNSDIAKFGTRTERDTELWQYAQRRTLPCDKTTEEKIAQIFENNLTQLFTKGFRAVLTSKDAVLKEVRDCILQIDAQRCKEVKPYLHSYWRDLHVRSGFVCVDERVAILHSIQDAVLESLHLPHPGSWGMIALGQYALWPYMHREIPNKAEQRKPCSDK